MSDSPQIGIQEELACVSSVSHYVWWTHLIPDLEQTHKSDQDGEARGQEAKTARRVGSVLLAWLAYGVERLTRPRTIGTLDRGLRDVSTS
jgi:hypothetical protein